MTDIVQVTKDGTTSIVDVGYSVAAPSSVPVSGGNMSGTLTLNGSPPLAIPSGAAAGDVLTSDASGNASWEPITGAELPAATSSSQGAIELNTDLGGTATAPHVVATHLASPLPVGQGGTGSTSQNFAGLLTPTGVKTAPYTANPGDYVLVSTASGAVTITLPSAPADLTAIAVKMVSSATHALPNLVTIAAGGTDRFNVGGGPTTLTLTLVGQASVLQYEASAGLWIEQAGRLPLSGLDTRYVTWFNVKNYGAVGNGSVDDTAAIQAAVNAAWAVGGGTIYFPNGSYSISTTITADPPTGPPVPNATTLSFKGEGPERSIISMTTTFTATSNTSPYLPAGPGGGAPAQPINAAFTSMSGMTNLYIEGLQWNMPVNANCNVIDSVYVTGLNKFTMDNCKFRGARRQLWIGYCSEDCFVTRTWHMNFRSCGIYVQPPNPLSSTNTGGQVTSPNFDSCSGQSTTVNVDNVCDAMLWIDCFTGGQVMSNIWAIGPGPMGTPGSNSGAWNAGVRIDGPEATIDSSFNAVPGTGGHFQMISEIAIDGIGGTTGPAPGGAGLLLNNVKQIQFADSFIGASPATLGGTGQGIWIGGGSTQILSGGANWISGKGLVVDPAAIVSYLQTDGDTYTGTNTGGALLFPSGALLQNILIGPANFYFVSQFPDAATAARILSAAPPIATRAVMTPPKFMVSSSGASSGNAQRLGFYNPVSNLSWDIDLLDSGNGMRVIDSGVKVVLEILLNGGMLIGNQTGTTNAPAAIRKITSQSTSYAGNATLAAGTRDTVTVTVTNANMAVTDGVVANASIDLPQGVSLKAFIASATTLTVYVENNGTGSANVLACTIRTTVFQYANP